MWSLNSGPVFILSGLYSGTSMYSSSNWTVNKMKVVIFTRGKLYCMRVYMIRLKKTNLELLSRDKNTNKTFFLSVESGT